ncbi:hypothetical protein SALBM311S_06841 [Streptomyces alboniger]
MVVELSVDGDSREYAAEIEQTAFRVVQEALTNVHKHAGGGQTHVRLAHRVAEIAMQVENDPRTRWPPPRPRGCRRAATGWWA